MNWYGSLSSILRLGDLWFVNSIRFFSSLFLIHYLFFWLKPRYITFWYRLNDLLPLSLAYTWVIFDLISIKAFFQFIFSSSKIADWLLFWFDFFHKTSIYWFFVLGTPLPLVVGRYPVLMVRGVNLTKNYS